jgi:hypothetical protein
MYITVYINRIFIYTMHIMNDDRFIYRCVLILNVVCYDYDDNFDDDEMINENVMVMAKIIFCMIRIVVGHYI